MDTAVLIVIIVLRMRIQGELLHPPSIIARVTKQKTPNIEPTEQSPPTASSSIRVEDIAVGTIRDGSRGAQETVTVIHKI